MQFRSYAMRGSLSLLLLSLLTGCTYIIPENPSAPRYNKVIGERRVPERNANMPKGGEESRMRDLPAAPPVTAADATQLRPAPEAAPVLAGLPPVDPEVRAIAERQMAAANPPESRQTPVENAPMMLAANLNSVPPRPAAVPIQTKLDATRTELETDRTGAAAAKEKLATDAAAEEPISMPAPLPPIVPAAPQPGSVQVPSTVRGLPVAPVPAAAPVPVPAPTPAPRSEAAPAPVTAARGFIAPPPLMLPPPPLPPLARLQEPAPLPSGPSEITVSSVAPPLPTAPAGALPAIQLRPPAAKLPAPASPRAAFPMKEFASPSSPPATDGGFNPMADAAPAASSPATYASSGFLPPSRYADRR